MGEIKLDNLIKALRCLASNNPEGDCYEEQYNFGRKGQRISCYGSPETMKCPYNQDTYSVCFEDGDCSEWLSEAAELLEELRQYRRIGTLEECREVNRLRKQMQWIPTKGRLPEDMEIVLVNDRYGNLYTAYHDCEGWHLAFNGLLFARDPLAWMPLPKPYNPLEEDADRKQSAWKQRMMSTFLGSRQEKKTERERENARYDGRKR